MYLIVYRNVSLLPVTVLCGYYLNAEQETPAVVKKIHLSVIFCPTHRGFFLLTKWEGGWREKIKKQQILMRCYAEE